MCGIAGQITFNGSPADGALVSRMVAPMAPRGPDGVGLWQQNRIALGHRRLKIIDLTDHAHQPMVDGDLGLTIAFNGCIYNYRELRAELEGLGYRFFSHGDTEVILKAWHAWGEEAPKRLFGMFALAIAERDTGRVILCRDRLGIKPLYLAEMAGELRFASTLPALLAGGGIDTDIDPAALWQYMSFHSIVPPPRTILKGVAKLPPATLMVIEPDGSRRRATYWKVTYGPQPGDEGKSFEDWQDEVLAVLRRAVERRLVADVPVGVLLSGGLDSSLVVGLLAEAGQHGLKTYSIGFETVGNEQGDEFRYSDVIARHFATDHHQIPVDSSQSLPALPACIAAMAEPMVSHDCIGFYLLSQEVAKTIKVVQSGQGADEIFAGYHWYPPMLESRDPLADYARHFFDRDAAEMRAILGPDALAGLDEDDPAEAFVADHFARPGAAAPIDKALRLDTEVMLVDDPVKRVDNMTMAFGLEARVPFLDHEVVELAARIPGALKTPEGGKHVLKEAARKVIPADVIDRPKGYFPVPALKYLQGPYLDMVREAVTSDAARARGLIREDYVATLLAAPEDHITPLRGSKLWQVALLELWLQQHGIRG